MKMKGAKTDRCGNDASINLESTRFATIYHNYNEWNTGKGNRHIREVFFRAIEKLQHDFRKYDERVKPEEVQCLHIRPLRQPYIKNSPNIPQNGLPNELCHGRTQNKDSQSHYNSTQRPHPQSINQRGVKTTTNCRCGNH